MRGAVSRTHDGSFQPGILQWCTAVAGALTANALSYRDGIRMVAGSGASFAHLLKLIPQVWCTSGDRWVVTESFA